MLLSYDCVLDGGPANGVKVWNLLQEEREHHKGVNFASTLIFKESESRSTPDNGVTAESLQNFPNV